MHITEAGCRVPDAGVDEQWVGEIELGDGHCVVDLPVDTGALLLRWLRSNGHTDHPVMLLPPAGDFDGMGRLALPSMSTPSLEVLAGIRATGPFLCPRELAAVDLAEIGDRVEEPVWLITPTPAVTLWNPQLLAGGIRYLRDPYGVIRPRRSTVKQQRQLLIDAMRGLRW